MRAEVGPRDLEQGTCVTARRDQPGKQGKAMGIPLEPEAFVAHIRQLLDEVSAQTRHMYRCAHSRAPAILRQDACEPGRPAIFWTVPCMLKHRLTRGEVRLHRQLQTLFTKVESVSNLNSCFVMG